MHPRFRSALETGVAAAEPNFVALEGYLAGRLMIEALKQLGDDPTRERFIDLFKTAATFDIDGLKLTYGPGDNQGSDQVYLTAIGSDGEITEVDGTGRE